MSFAPSVRRALTGTTTRGLVHLRNRAAAIRRALAASRQDNVKSRYRLAD